MKPDGEEADPPLDASQTEDFKTAMGANSMRKKMKKRKLIERFNSDYLIEKDLRRFELRTVYRSRQL